MPMTEWELLNHMRQRILIIRAKMPTNSDPRVMEDLDECIRIYDDALLSYVTRNNITLDAADPYQNEFRFPGPTQGIHQSIAPKKYH